MRIAIVTSELNPHELRWAQGLRARGAEALVVMPFGIRTGLAAAWVSGFAMRDMGAEWGDAVRTVRIPILRQAGALRALLKRERIAVALAGWIPNDGLVLACSGFRPFVLYPFGSDLLLRARDSLRAACLTREVLRAADRVVFQSGVLRAAGEALAGAQLPPCEVIPYGVDTVRFNREGGDGLLRASLGVGERPLVVSTRNLAPVYGVDRLLRAFARARESLPEAFLALCGDGPLRGELEALARSLGIGEAVRFLGRVDRDLLPRWLPDADLYVSASLSDGASVSLMEAMACGLPCVVSGIPANLEMIDEGKTGFCSDYGGSEAAGRIAEVLRDRPRARAMGMEARAAAVERYDAARAHDRLWEVCRRLAPT